VGRDSAGQLRNVTTRFINLGGVDADGLDFYAAYAFQDVLNGQLILDGSATYITSFDIDFGDGGPTFDGSNNRNSFIDLLGSVPELRLNLGASWMNVNQFAGFYIRHIGGYDDRERNSANDTISSATLLDVNYGYTFDGLLGRGATSVSVGINNLTDKDPPAIDRGSVNGRIGFDQQVYDPRGRVWYVRLLHSF
jgi:hypothetical protein